MRPSHVPPALQTPLLGHLSDMNGRKPFFLLSQVGGHCTVVHVFNQLASIPGPCASECTAPTPPNPHVQACSCVPLTIITLHLTSGLPLIWYYLANVSEPPPK